MLLFYSFKFKFIKDLNTKNNKQIVTQEKKAIRLAMKKMAKGPKDI